MSSVGNGLWRGPQNTKIPGPSLVLSYRASGLTAAAAATILVPSTVYNPGQVAAAAAPYNYAPQASPVIPNASPQQGLRCLVTELIVRDITNASGQATLGSSSTVVSLYDANYNGSTGVYTDSNASGFTPAAFGSANTVLAVTVPATAAAGNQTPFAHVAQGTGALIVIRPYDQLAINLPASTGGTATGFTLDVIGMWVQAV